MIEEISFVSIIHLTSVWALLLALPYAQTIRCQMMNVDTSEEISNQVCISCPFLCCERVRTFFFILSLLYVAAHSLLTAFGWPPQ